MSDKKILNSSVSVNSNSNNKDSNNTNTITSINNIPIEVFNEFEEIRKSGVTNMCLKDIVVSLAFEKGYINLGSYCIDVDSKTGNYTIPTSRYTSILKSYNKYYEYLKSIKK